MKKLFGLAIIILLTACSSQKIQKSPIETFVQPCSQYMQEKNGLRAWGIGKSDSEATARKKAIAMASADLAEQLGKTIKKTREDYNTILSEGNNGKSKTLTIEKVLTSVDKNLSNTGIICDQWVHDNETNQYTNYIVMELDVESYLEYLKETMAKEGVDVDSELLNDIFMKCISE